MKLLRSSLLALGVFSFSACERGKAPARVDSVPSGAQSAVDSVTAVPASSWDPSAGPVLLVAAESPSRAYVLLPDSATAAAALANIPHPASVTLLGRGGTVQTAEIPSVDDTGACAAASLSAAPPPRPWNIGFIGGVVAPLGVDSMESLSRPDSGSIATAIIRLASALPNDSAGRFTGLPFVVRSLWRFAVPGGAVVVVASLARQINQEATPLQERTLLIAEQAQNDTAFATAYSQRAYGDEDTIESQDVLAAALLGAQRTPAIVLARDFGDSIAYALLERNASGDWATRWVSARRHC
jgi:hypothetical protein